MKSAKGDGAAGKQVSAADEAALKELEFDWGEAYLIGRDDERGWWASRRDRIGSVLTAPGPDELRTAIRADYGLKPVPRDPVAGDGRP